MYSPTSVYSDDVFGLSTTPTYINTSPAQSIYLSSTISSPYMPISPVSSPYMPISPVSSPYAAITLPITTPYSDDALLESPVLTSLNLTYSEPVFGIYENMNVDPKLHSKMVKHFYYYKVLGDWIYDELSELLGYLTVKDGKVKLISSVDKYDESSVDKDSKKNVEMKIEYFKEKVFKKNDMMFLLKNFVSDTHTNWYDLPHKERKVLKAIKRYIDKKFRKMIKKKKE